MGKRRFFKAYFIASLIYAVWFGVLMYAVDPMFLDVMECNTLPSDYLCVQSGYNRPIHHFSLSVSVHRDLQPFARQYYEMAQTPFG